MANQEFTPDTTVNHRLRLDGGRDTDTLPELEEMDEDKLRAFAAKAKVDLEGVSTEPGIRDRIRKAAPVEQAAAESTEEKPARRTRG